MSYSQNGYGSKGSNSYYASSGGYNGNAGGYSSGGGGGGGGGSYYSNGVGFASANSFHSSQSTASSTPPPQDLTPFSKNFYKEREQVTRLSQEEVRQIRKDLQVNLVSLDTAVPNPIRTFDDIDLPENIQREFKNAGFTCPSSIQSQAWPIALSGRDLIGIAETGSGKTLAFLVPAIIHIQAQPRVRNGEGPICLILGPTRELVEQINQECGKFSFGLRHGVAYGGVPRRQQQMNLRRGCEIVAACPGRLIDFIDRGDVSMSRVTYLTLDEADRMLDMGFEPQIRKIVSHIRSDRQTLMYSATWPKEVQSLARDLCREDPVRIVIGSTEIKASHSVKQTVYCIDNNDKYSRLIELLRGEMKAEEKPRTLVFVETKRSADILVNKLRAEGCNALSIHGDKDQAERTWVIDEFRNGRAPIVIATDVASRGLDIKNVKIVINYDFPNQVEDYVHRIGRTGRAGAQGSAYTFFTSANARMARELVGILQEAKQEVAPELQAYVGSSGGGGSFNRNSRYGRGGSGGYGSGGAGGSGGGFKRWGTASQGGPYGRQSDTTPHRGKW